GVHGAGARGADAFERDALVFEQPVEYAPGEGAVGAAALQRQVDRLRRYRGTPPPLGAGGDPRTRVGERGVGGAQGVGRFLHGRGLPGVPSVPLSVWLAIGAGAGGVGGKDAAGLRHISGDRARWAVQRKYRPAPEEMTDCGAGDRAEGNAESL